MKYLSVLTIVASSLLLLNAGEGYSQDKKTLHPKSIALTPVKKNYGDKLVVITYNTKSDRKPNGYGWKKRLNAFAVQIANPYKPAIIALQEVYEHSGCSSFCDNCTKIKWGSYLNYFIEDLNAVTHERYKIATNVRSGKKKLCDSVCVEGEAILYNSNIVELIPLRPKKHIKGCKERRKNLEHHYGHNMEYNDCFPKKKKKNAYAARSVFEFPKHSGQFFSLYNTHGKPCDITKAIQYIIARQNTLQYDLKKHFKGSGKENKIKLYPPIFTGDMNSDEYVKCQDPYNIYM